MADVPDQLFQKAQTYLRSAAVLFELEDFDSCASRAYFAMFFAAQAALLHEHGALPSKQGIRTMFVQTFVDSGMLPEQAGAALQNAYDLQEKGDFAHEFAVSQDEAEHALQQAEAFVNTLDQLRAPSS